MTIQQIINLIDSQLKPKFPSMEVLSLRNIIFEEILNIPKEKYLIDKQNELDKKAVETVYSVLEKLKKDVPIQYITGKTEFLDIKLNLTQDVLIPRPETEELVHLILKNDLKNKTILDIGTGSGCIAIAIAKHCGCKVFATDISKNALKIAQTNAQQNNVEVTFLEHNILTENKIILENETVKFDLIVSNPPYIAESEKKEMQNNVLDYEPHKALFVSDEKPIIFYENIANFASKNLNKNGLIYLEINPKFWYETIEAFKKSGFENITLRRDLFGKRRFLIVKN